MKSNMPDPAPIKAEIGSTTPKEHEEQQSAARGSELPPEHPARRQVEEGSAAAHAAMPSVKLPLPAREHPAASIGLSEDARVIAAEAERIVIELEREVEYLRVRMMVAVSFLDSDTLDTFHEHTAEIDAKHREATYGR